jgi:hypothetical protein
MDAFAGFVELGDVLRILLQTRNTSTGAPVNADALPTFRVYGQTGVINNGTSAKLQSGNITGATNASPIVITSTAHGLTTGAVVTISGVGGNTAANTTAVATVLDANTFSIPVAGNGAYTSGGVWNATGLYAIDITASALNGFASGINYTCVATWAVSSVNQDQLSNFNVL